MSANAHGITTDDSMIESILSMDVVTAAGELIKVDRDTNAELFSLIVGGCACCGSIDPYCVCVEVVKERNGEEQRGRIKGGWKAN